MLPMLIISQEATRHKITVNEAAPALRVNRLPERRKYRENFKRSYDINLDHTQFEGGGPG